ncbi:hypothetical protein [Dendronalium sp. ChiSLP03b]|uniref:hypothetical protein n=1 Tax=Dendronalium sp. ChiSLP03b TaxID=3075381 RepID=UPI00391A7D34
MQIIWLERLRRWIKRFFRPKKRRTAPTILKRWYGKHCAVLRLERNTPGGLSTYRITSLYGSYDYLVTLDNLRELHTELVGEFEGTPIRIPTLDYSHNTAITHRFAVFRLGRDGSSQPIGIWDVDLQGFTANYSLREIAPKRALCGVALRSLSIIHSTKTPSLSWASQMDRMDWLGLLREKIRAELQNPNHNLKACIILHESS